MITDLTLSFVYDHPLAGSWSLYDLQQFQGVIGPENLDSTGWWMAYGGLQIFRDRIFRFFDQRQAPLSAYVVFVLQSLFPQQSLPLPLIQSTQQVPTDPKLIALLGLPDQSRLILCEQDSITHRWNSAILMELFKHHKLILAHSLNGLNVQHIPGKKRASKS